MRPKKGAAGAKGAGGAAAGGGKKSKKKGGGGGSDSASAAPAPPPEDPVAAAQRGALIERAVALRGQVDKELQAAAELRQGVVRWVSGFGLWDRSRESLPA